VEDFKGGSAIYAFDFNPDNCNGFHDHIDLAGNIDFEVIFKTPLTAPVSMVIMSQYDNQLTLDGQRNVLNQLEPVAVVL
jgi:hypothetical protein